MNAPDRIWIDGDATGSKQHVDWDWDSGCWGHQQERDGEWEYIRADLVPQWQPIETAPKHDLETLILYSSEGVQMGWFSAFHKCWLTTEGKDVWAEPTHWMPLPEPPKNS